MRKGIAACAEATVAETVPAIAATFIGRLARRGSFYHKEYQAAVLAVEATAGAARVPLPEVGRSLQC